MSNETLPNASDISSAAMMYTPAKNITYDCKESTCILRYNTGKLYLLTWYSTHNKAFLRPVEGLAELTQAKVARGLVPTDIFKLSNIKDAEELSRISLILERLPFKPVITNRHNVPSLYCNIQLSK